MANIPDGEDHDILVETSGSEPEVIPLDDYGSDLTDVVSKIYALVVANEHVRVTFGGVSVVVTEIAPGRISFEVPQLVE